MNELLYMNEVCCPSLLVMLKVAMKYRYVTILTGIERYRYLSNGIDKINSYNYYPISVATFVRMCVRLKILYFTKELFLILQVYTFSKEFFRNLLFKSIHIFSLVPISEVAPEFSREIIIKIFQKFVVNVSKTFLTIL